MSASAAEPHRWTFYTAGGVPQVRIATGADILALPQLDPKLWLALSCPVKGLELDERTLTLLDTDGDGRVRAPEVIAAIEWLRPRLREADDLLAGADALPLARIDERTPEGKRALAAARRLLSGLGKVEAASVTVDDVRRASELHATARFNGDGVLPPASVHEPEVARVAEEVVACLGGAPDRGGALGVTEAQLDSFYAELEAYAAWWAEGEAASAEVHVLGKETEAAAQALEAVRAKVDDFFARCRLAAFDPRAAGTLSPDDASFAALKAQTLSATAEEASGLPLARVEPGRALPLSEGVNPAWAAALERLRARVVAPLLGAAVRELDDAGWAGLVARFAPYRAWQADKAGAAVERLGIARVRELLAGDARARLAALIAEDAAAEEELSAIAEVERLVHYLRDFHRLLLNFVSFSDFYARRKATFQAGTLYLDGRSCDLCVWVDDAAKHAALAALAKTYLVYCDCTRKAGGEKLTIAAALTAGDADRVMVGRNGLFYDRQGRDWDATVTRIVEHPISVRQAAFLPYKRLLRWVEEMAAKRAQAADTAAAGKLQAAASAGGEAAESGKAPAQKPKFDVGVVAALGVAVGGITAALGALLEAFFGLGRWMPLGVAALLLLISGPSMLIAWMKLRQRNLGPILDANGWAVNGRVSINLPLGGSLTTLPKLPPGAIRLRHDPFAPRRSRWQQVLLLIAIVAGGGYGLFRAGYLARLFPGVEWLVPPAPAEAPADAPPS